MSCLAKLGFHLREELNDAASVMFPEKLLQLGTADEVVVADGLHCQVFLYVLLQIKQDFIVDGRGFCGAAKAGAEGGGQRRHCVSAYQGNEDFLKIHAHQLLCAEHAVLPFFHFFHIGVVQRRCDAASRFCNKKPHEISLAVCDVKGPVLKKLMQGEVQAKDTTTIFGALCPAAMRSWNSLGLWKMISPRERICVCVSVVTEALPLSTY